MRWRLVGAATVSDSLKSLFRTAPITIAKEWIDIIGVTFVRARLYDVLVAVFVRLGFHGVAVLRFRVEVAIGRNLVGDLLLVTINLAVILVYLLLEDVLLAITVCTFLRDVRVHVSFW